MTPKHVEGLINDALSFAYDNGVSTSRVDPSRAEYLRISSLPFCARAWWLEQATSLSKRRTSHTSGLYYLQLGTTVHELLQGAIESCTMQSVIADSEKTLPHKAVLVQDWKCRNCGHRHRFVPRPDTCEWCGESGDRMLAMEHQVRYGRCTLGHMDGTLAFPNPDAPKEPYNKKWLHVPLDYKTTSMNAVGGKTLPYAGNVTQLTTYGAIKQHDGYIVPGVVLVYVPRDNPNKRRNCYVPLKYAAVIKALDGYEDLYLRARAANTLKLGLALPPKVTSGFESKCTFCKYIKTCEANSKGDSKPLHLLAEQTLKFLNSPSRNSSWPEA